jgi:hypothetical protein
VPEIRLLTLDDYPAMEAVVDSRPSFQGTGVDATWHTRTKEVYIKNRIGRDGVFWFGYFSDTNELLGFHEAHTIPFPFAQFDFVDGVTYTLKGKADERWQDTQRSKIAIELLNYTIDFFEKTGNLKSYWVVGPLIPASSGRFVETPGSRLMDGTWNRTDVGQVTAGKFTGDHFIDSWLLMDGIPNKDQLVMKFDKIGWKDPRLPPDAPEPTPNSFSGIHPPEGKYNPRATRLPPE